MIWKFTVTAFFLKLTACASTAAPHIDRIKEGMDKSEVLDTVGNPKRTVRTNGEDHWIYVFFKNGEEFHRQISFGDGKVVKIGASVPKRNWDKEIESTKRTDSGFRAIDGGSDDVKKPK